MKRIILLVTLLCFALAGCGADLTPESPGDGPLVVGNRIRVDPIEGFTPMEYNDVLAADGMYYATWSMGEAKPYTNEDGDEAEVFDAQAYLVLSEKTSAENAQGALDEMLELANSRYQVESTSTETYEGQPYTVLTFRYLADTNPYAVGAAAFGIRGSCLVNVEVSCLEDGPDPLELLEDFLHGWTYLDEEGN